MANRRRSNARGRDRKPKVVVSYHTHVRVGSWCLAIPLTLIGLPGLLLPPIGYLVARLIAHAPDMTDKDPWGRPAPGYAQRRQAASYRRAVRWMGGDWLVPRSADWCASLILAAPAAIPGTAMMPGMPVDLGAWTPALDFLGMLLFAQATWAVRRDRTLTVRGLDSNTRQRRVPFAASRRTPILATLAAGVFAGALTWAATGLAWPLPALAGLCGWPMLRAHRAAKRQADDEESASLMLLKWLEATGKPPVARPGRVSNLKRGRHGEMLFMLDVTNGPREWVTDACRDRLAPHAAGDGMLVGFAMDGGDTRHVVCAVCPSDPVDPDDLMADEIGWQARLTVDEHRIAVKFSSFPGRIVKARKVASLEGRPAAWVFDVSGSNSTWDDIALNWFTGRDDEWGDWGCAPRLEIHPDSSHTFAWIWARDADWRDFDWDERAVPGCARPDPVGYLGRMFEDERTIADWTAGLSGFKLSTPVAFSHRDGECGTLRAKEGWALTLQTGTLPRDANAVDYMSPKIDLAGSFGDSLLAEAMPSPDPAQPGRFRMRYLRFLRMPKARCNVNAPRRLDDLAGDDKANATLAVMLMSRALRTCLKTPAFVGDAAPCHKRGAGWALWRMPVQLNGGVTPADVRRAEARIRATAGATTIIWQWRDAGHVTAWAGSGWSTERHGWADRRLMDTVVGLALDDAWATAGVTSPDGRTPHTEDVEDSGALRLYTFGLPAGLSADDAYSRIDRFQAAAGMAYAKRAPGDDPGTLRLLLAERSPLPPAVIASPADPDPRGIGVYGTLDRVRPGDRILPFGTLDDGTVAALDPKDTPHLLCSGTTGSGKSSVMVTLTRAALMAGWRVAVADPSKGAKDFAPIEDRLLAREETLAGTNALLDWAMAEMHRRRDLIGQAGDLDGLDPGVRPPRLLIVIDEFNSLLTKGGVQVANPNNDPDIDNKNMRSKWEDGLRAKIGLDVSDLLRQARALNIMLLLGAQKLNASDLDLLPDAGTAKGMLGHVFLGNGDTAGNVSQSNIREANRLLKQAMGSGGMPKGRGLYERMGRGVNMFQAWWGGAGDDLKAACAALPDVEPLDLSAFMPAPPALIGVVEQSDTTVEDTLVDADSDEWELD